MPEFKKDKFLNFTAGILLIGFIYLVFKELQSILLPFFVALIIAFIFEPFYRLLKIKKIPAGIAIIIILIIIIVISNLASLFIFTSVQSFQAQLPKYQEKFVQMYISLMKSIELNPIYKQFFRESFQYQNLLAKINIGGLIENLLSGALGLFGNFILILIYVAFLLSEIGSFRKRIRQAFSTERAKKISSAIDDVFDDIKKYVINKTLINFSHGLAVYIVLLFFGVDFAIVWGFLTFLMAFIPNIGAIIATILPFLTALIQFDGIITPILILIVLTVVGFLAGNIVEPKIFGHTLNLSPILILFSLIFWGYVWGIVGMLLAVPILSMIKIILSKFESTRTISLLMAQEIKVDSDIVKKPKQLSIFKRTKKETSNSSHDSKDAE